MSTPQDDVAVAYIRVSTSEQHIGPQAQDYAIRRWCEQHGITLACEPFFDHGVSGGLDLDKRPALLDAMDALKIHNAAILLAHKRDRLARDRSVIGQLDMLLRRDGRRICTTEHEPSVDAGMSPYVRAMEGMQDVFAEFERAMIKARVKAALAVKRRKGERIGTIPYGWRLGPDGKRLVRDAKEQRAVKLIRSLRADGSSLRQIAAELDRRGHKPRRGKAWYPTTLKNVAEYDPPEGDR